jgi:cytoskeleton protein RodZ
VEVQDARNLVLFSRTLQPGETVGLNGNLPIRVKVGNAAATQVQFKGKPVDLQAVTRDNVARVELK